jgi:protein-disulfide isomerase
VVLAIGAYGFSVFHEAKEDAQTGGVASRIVDQYFGLPEVPLPGVLSPLWSIRSTEAFADAPVRIVEYTDLLCPDCRFLAEQLHRLEEEFPGKINVIFQPFPLEAACNDVVEKDLHPGACEITYMAAHDPEKFRAIHDEIWASWPAPRDPEWRRGLAERHGVGDAVSDPETRDLVHTLIQTGKEYEKTSDRYSYGIRSTPTMILNGRMVIGTLPYEQLKVIIEAIIRQAEGGDRFLEAWERS